jgi:hypothetical protein
MLSPRIIRVAIEPPIPSAAGRSLPSLSLGAATLFVVEGWTIGHLLGFSSGMLSHPRHSALLLDFADPLVFTRASRGQRLRLSETTSPLCLALPALGSFAPPQASFSGASGGFLHAVLSHFFAPHPSPRGHPSQNCPINGGEKDRRPLVPYPPLEFFPLSLFQLPSTPQPPTPPTRKEPKAQSQRFTHLPSARLLSNTYEYPSLQRPSPRPPTPLHDNRIRVFDCSRARPDSQTPSGDRQPRVPDDACPTIARVPN